MLKRALCLFLFLPVLQLGLPQALPAGESELMLNHLRSELTLNKLIEISMELSALNEKLQEELRDSRQNSQELETALKILKEELDKLRNEAKTLQTGSMGLLSTAENSLTELNRLRAALQKAESSLMSLELSFEAYRQASQTRTRSLERQNRFLKWGAAAAGVLALGLTAALLFDSE